MESLKSDGWKLVAIEQIEGGQELQDVEIHADEKIALIFGNEVHGVSDEVLDLIDVAVEVPQFGTKHSLNISVCAGIVIWEFYRKINA